MEEKERYVIGKSEDIFIADNDRKVMFTITKKKLQDLLNQQDKELSKLRASYQQVKEENRELKKQLAESEKNFIIANNLRKNTNEVLLNYKTEKYGLDKTIQELRKIKLSFPEKEWYYKGFENCERQMSSHIADLTLEVKQLKQQLARTEKALELAVGQLDDAKDMLRECGKHDWAGMIDTSVDYFKARVKEMLKK